MHVLMIGGTGNISTVEAVLLYQQGHAITTVTTGKHPVPEKYDTIILDRNNTGKFKDALCGLIPDVVIDFIGFVPEQLRVDFDLFKGKK